ncbi:putative MFS family arabinose efflux permease [Arenicella xantha]|uniref:Putative MFS family arabinose efflux permease n=2 Tax=Arenicella xantha TaxID=644221 RepID=A0A395JGV9_9GAMM|nr:putative MFS family arabinose efflux permease [Arenicella xantha]
MLLMMSFGFRSSFGLFVKPISEFHNWGRDTIAIALAIQNLSWGVVAVFAGGLADRYGNLRIILGAVLVYAVGLFSMAYADTPLLLNSSAGILVGAGIAGTSFGIVIPALMRAVPDDRKPWVAGIATAAGSMGQFLIVPFSQTLIDAFGWFSSLQILSAMTLLMVIMAIPLAPYSGANEVHDKALDQSTLEALKEAFQHKHYVLLVIGFYVCGFHLAFITVHMPAYLSDLGFSAKVGAWSLALIGVANMIGSYMSGVWSGRVPKQSMLAWIYLLRALVIAIFIILPASIYSIVFFSIGIGLLWLATIPPTSGLVAVMFGTRYMALLYGVVFLSHQLGSFTGVYLGGFLYEQSDAFQVVSSFCGQYLGFSTYGDAARYDLVWLINILLGVLAAIIHLPIRERAVGRFARAQ